jgi:hypothetical protein
VLHDCSTRPEPRPPRDSADPCSGQPSGTRCTMRHGGLLTIGEDRHSKDRLAHVGH